MRPIAGWRRSRGFTLLELAVVAIVLAILAVVLLERLTYYAEVAERTAMETQVRLFKAGLQLRLADLISKDRQGEAVALETENPARWLDKKPQNYGGEYGDGASRGNWYFDANNRHLVYVANNTRFLEAEVAGGMKQVRFQARLVYDVIHVSGGPVRSVAGVALVPVRPYRWS